MDNENQKPENSESEEVANKKRRSLTKAALAAPVVMTIANKPAWGAQCSTSGMQSGTHSGEDEIQCLGCTPGYWGTHPYDWHADYNPGTCKNGDSTVGQGFCKKNNNNNNNNEDPTGAYDFDGTIFNDVFTAARVIYSIYDDVTGGDRLLTMMQVINLGGGNDKKDDDPDKVVDGYQLGAHAASALLNAAKFLELTQTKEAFGYTPTEIIQIWEDWEGSNEELKQFYEILNTRTCPSFPKQ